MRSPVTSITYCGSVSLPTAFAMANRMLVEGLRNAGYTVKHVDSLDQADHADDTVIFLDFMDHFGLVARPPRCRHFIAIRTWDFGPYPSAWRRKINDICDQLWVFCAWVRTLAIASDIRPDLVHVVPLGFDERVFAPSGERYPLSTTKRFKFLFVGGAVFRKGFDILLDAYTQTFTAADDVCLVVHAHEADPFYERIHMLTGVGIPAAGGPEVLLHRKFLSREELAGVYRACDVGVFPYRAEGFAMPILEGLGAGLPPIVPRFGASLDYCGPENSFQVSARRIALPVRDSFVTNAFGFRERLDAVDFCQVAPATLGKAMRAAYEMPTEQLRLKADAAARTVREGFTERHMVAAAVRALKAL